MIATTMSSNSQEIIYYWNNNTMYSNTQQYNLVNINSEHKIRCILLRGTIYTISLILLNIISLTASIDNDNYTRCRVWSIMIASSYYISKMTAYNLSLSRIFYVLQSVSHEYGCKKTYIEALRLIFIFVVLLLLVIYAITLKEE